MDKNNDMQVYKISKWKAAPDSIKDLYSAINAIFAAFSLIIDPKVADNKNYTLNELLARILDDYNELEAKHQKECGMISEYEEENRILREQRKKLAEDNGYLRRERDRHIDLLDKLRWALEDMGIWVEWNERALKWNLYDNANICKYCKKHFEDELRIRCKEIDDKNKLIEELNQTARHECEELHEKIEALEKEKIKLEADNRDLEVQAQVNASTASTYESEIKQIIELAKSYGLIIYDARKDAKPNDAVNIGMCGYYYILDRDIKNENQRLKDRCNELAYRARRLEKKNDELSSQVNSLKEENDRLRDALAYCEMTGFTIKGLSDSIKNKAKQARNIDPNGDDI